MGITRLCFGVVLLCMIIAPSQGRKGNLDTRMTKLENNFENIENKFENMEKNMKLMNIALSKLVTMLEKEESVDEENGGSREKREILGNTAVGDVTLKQLIDAQRSYGDKAVRTEYPAGSSYVRWGRKSCGETAQQLYSGIAAGQHYHHSGGASNYQCLPLDPEYNNYTSADSLNWIYGAEYQSYGLNIFDKSMHDQNVPCARCYVPTRATTIMIPAKRTCPNSWTKEYEGYLMAGQYQQPRAYNYVCMDQQPEAIVGLHENKDGALFYFVQGDCHTLGHCPPYKQGAELACVVCSN